MQENRFISAKEAIEKGYCKEVIEGKIKWLIDESTDNKLISTFIGGDFNEKLLVSSENKILGLSN